MTRLFFVTVLTVEILTFTLGAEELPQLKGTQTLKAVTIVQTTSHYLVTGTYEVPADSELTIEAGTKLAFAKDAALVIRGRLFIKGTECPRRVIRESHRHCHLAGIANQQLP